MEKLQDPEEVRRLLHTVRHRGTLGETMADRIVREALEAQVVSVACKLGWASWVAWKGPTQDRHCTECSPRAQGMHHCCTALLPPVQADLNRKMRDATSKRELCEHGHQHDVCCGASKGEVEPEA